MSRIVFLNGCGSSGKTSVARGIQYLSDDLWISLGVDAFMDMLPYMREDQYVEFSRGENVRGPTTRVHVTQNGVNFFGTLPYVAKAIADAGHDLVIDELLFGDEILVKYADSLKDHTVYFIGLFCSLERMQEREILRRDRYVGLSNDQVDRVHKWPIDIYDMVIDTTNITAFESASRVLEFIQYNPSPKAFKKVLHDFKIEQ